MFITRSRALCQASPDYDRMGESRAERLNKQKNRYDQFTLELSFGLSISENVCAEAGLERNVLLLCFQLQTHDFFRFLFGSLLSRFLFL